MREARASGEAVWNLDLAEAVGALRPFSLQCARLAGQQPLLSLGCLLRCLLHKLLIVLQLALELPVCELASCNCRSPLVLCQALGIYARLPGFPETPA